MRSAKLIVSKDDNTVFCNGAIALLHSPGMNTARKLAEKVDVQP
ncbi:hypothetical protein [uncultured Nostoc sp.]